MFKCFWGIRVARKFSLGIITRNICRLSKNVRNKRFRVFPYQCNGDLEFDCEHDHDHDLKGHVKVKKFIFSEIFFIDYYSFGEG